MPRTPSRSPRTRPTTGSSIPPAWVDAAGQLYVGGVRARGGLDAAISACLRKLRTLEDDGRTFAVDTAQAMYRARARLEAAAEALDFSATRHALVCMFLAGARGVASDALPARRQDVEALVRAWRSTEAAALTVRASLPAWLIERLVGQHGAASGEALALALAADPPVSLRVNTLKADRPGLLAALAREHIDADEGTLAPDAVTLRQRADVMRTRAYQDGLFEVQDEGSQLVSLCCEVAPGMTVVDACAGAGGKTLHLAARMRGKGTLFALDVHQGRLAGLRARAARAGAHHIRVHDARDHALRRSLAGRADVVLVDAPCSGTGVLRRNPDISWTLSPGDVERLRAQQRDILADAAALVAPGGRLVYATCSLLDVENEAQARAFEDTHAGFRRMDVGAALARAGVALVGESLRVDPRHSARPDGFFAAAWVRS